MSTEKLTTAQVYNSYDQIFTNVERWINSKNPSVWWCDKDQVKARITQRIVELSCDAYTEFAVINVDQSGSALGSGSSVVNIGGLKIQTDTCAVALEPTLWIRHIGLFAATWGHLLVFIIAALFCRSPRRSTPATLLMEAGGGYDESDAHLVRFCREGPIALLRAAKHIIIRSTVAPKNSTNPSIVYAKDPLLCLINTQLQWSQKAALLIQHLFAPVLFVRALFACPASVLIAQDLSYIPVVRWLDKHALIDAIVITTSAFRSQPLWMRAGGNQHFDLHMIWYSQNFIPKVYIGEEESSSLPSARHMYVDVHWVWTEGFKMYLKSLRQNSEIHVVGPILWYLPLPAENFDDSKLKIAVFDITPVPDGHRVFGALTNYYTVRLMEKFVADIVEICNEFEKIYGKEIIILLKHKRAPKIGFHAVKYLNFIDTLLTENSNLSLLDHNYNLFRLMDECVCSISVPYTSTAYVSAALEKTSIYYDPFGQLVPKYEDNRFIKFSSSQAELQKLIEVALNIRPNIEQA